MATQVRSKNLIQVLLADIATFIKLLLVPVLFFATCNAAIAIGSAIAYYIASHGQTGSEIFFQVMNLESFNFADLYVAIMVPFNWLALGGMIYFSGYSIAGYFRSIQDRVRTTNSDSLPSKPSPREPSVDNSDYKTAANG